MGIAFDSVLLPETVTINTVGGKWLRICTVDEKKTNKQKTPLGYETVMPGLASRG